MSSRKKLRIAITPGDPSGIGPEIVLKSLPILTREFPRIQFVLVGSPAPFKRKRCKIPVLYTAEELPFFNRFNTVLLPAPNLTRPHSRAENDGFQSGWSVEVATQLTLDRTCEALVTGPLDKLKLNLGGFRFPGHTELLGSICRAPDVTMMLANHSLRVSLVTTHIPLASVSKEISGQTLSKTLKNTVAFLKESLGIAKPRIALCGLNPHAGEGGLLGTEETKILIPFIRSARQKWRSQILLDGPFPSDTLFAEQMSKKPSHRWDAIISLYHDQGLGPIKTIDFKNTVNITLGLPIIRTSVDHGVAYSLVNTGRADPSSFLAATRLAIKLAKRRVRMIKNER